VSSASNTVATPPDPSLVPVLEEDVPPPVQSPPVGANLAPAESGAMTRLPPPPAEAPPPALSPESLNTLATIEPQSGTSERELGSALQVAAVATVAIPAPPRSKATSRYWVEYAVFAHERSAQRLSHALVALHLGTSVVATHAPDGRRLWRVRSAMAARADAEADARLAQQKLGLKPLIHRAVPRGEPRAQYWVQFGAFPTIAPAVHLQQVLADNGLEVIANTPSEFAAMIRDDARIWNAAAATAGLISQ